MDIFISFIVGVVVGVVFNNYIKGEAAKIEADLKDKL